jgi:hypothetical protein
MTMWRCAIAVLVCALCLGGCAKAVPEYNLYVQAFDVQYEQGNAVLDIFAQSERIIVRRRLDRQSTTFEPDKAAYYVDGVDPPTTAAIRAALKALKNYNEALGGLASGEAVEVLTSRFGTLATNTATAVSVAGVAVGGPASTAGGEVLVAGVARSLEVAFPMFKQAATAASREAFRQQLVAAYPAMREVIVEVRKGTPLIYETMRRSLVQRGSLETASGLSAEGDRVMEKNRQLVAAWVVSMDKALVALDEAVAATRAGGGTSARIASLTSASVELMVFAEQMKAIRLRPVER